MLPPAWEKVSQVRKLLFYLTWRFAPGLSSFTNRHHNLLLVTFAYRHRGSSIPAYQYIFIVYSTAHLSSAVSSNNSTSYRSAVPFFSACGAEDGSAKARFPAREIFPQVGTLIHSIPASFRRVHWHILISSIINSSTYNHHGQRGGVGSEKVAG